MMPVKERYSTAVIVYAVEKRTIGGSGYCGRRNVSHEWGEPLNNDERQNA